MSSDQLLPVWSCCEIDKAGAAMHEASMGMDGVELVMRFEEGFGIQIPDSAAAAMRTPRHVIDFVIEQRRLAAEHDVRAHATDVLAEMGHLPVSPGTAFNDLFQGRTRIRQWNEFRAMLAPFTAPPAKMHGPGGTIAGIGMIALLTSLYLGQWPLAGFSALVSGTGILWTRRSMSIPAETDTLQKLVQRLSRPIPASEVAAKVKSIVLEQLGLSETAYAEDRRFVEDFGMD